jgi:hypothetical protein
MPNPQQQKQKQSNGSDYLVKQLPDFEEKIRSKWDLERLYKNLEQTKTKSLTPLEKTYLCLLLDKKSTLEISNLVPENKLPQNTVDKIVGNIYSYIKTYTKRDIKDWRDVFLFLADDYYHNHNNSSSLLGWVWIGAVNNLYDRLPPPQTPLVGKDPSFTPVTIKPSLIPNIGDTVEITGNVNLRDNAPKQVNSQVISRNIVATLTNGQKVTVLELTSYIIKGSYTGIWAKVNVS